MAHPLSRRRDGRRWDSMSHNSGDEYAWLSAHGYGKPSASRVYARAQAAEPFWTADRFHAVGWHTRPLLRQVRSQEGRQLQRSLPDVLLHDGFLPCSRSEEHTSELQSLMRTSYAVFCLK